MNRQNFENEIECSSVRTKFCRVTFLEICQTSELSTDFQPIFRYRTHLCLNATLLIQFNRFIKFRLNFDYIGSIQFRCQSLSFAARSRLLFNTVSEIDW